MAASGDWSDQLKGLQDGGESILKKPCVRNSLMAGIATGTFMGMHKFRMGRELIHRNLYSGAIRTLHLQAQIVDTSGPLIH